MRPSPCVQLPAMSPSTGSDQAKSPTCDLILKVPLGGRAVPRQSSPDYRHRKPALSGLLRAGGNGLPGRIRTPGLSLRKAALCPTELRAESIGEKTLYKSVGLHVLSPQKDPAARNLTKCSLPRSDFYRWPRRSYPAGVPSTPSFTEPVPYRLVPPLNWYFTSRLFTPGLFHNPLPHL